ncbi:MAG: hypothetical protein ACD_73C00408G0003 [uncultured bacterium]|nr:MAG: hypothetical protein ACD_73C00408G0003 [uncultured bacterium]
MIKTRVLIVDDSVVIRKIVGDILSAEADVEIVGKAGNGQIALQMIPQVNPDIITLDVEMPVMDGLTTLAEIRKKWPKLPVIMFSTLTQTGTKTTVEALSLGASDFVSKPANQGSAEAATKYIRDQLVEKIHNLCPQKGAPVQSQAQTVDASKWVKPQTGVKPIEIVAIGCSTGGPNALAALFPTFPANFPVPIVIVQHMPPVFTKLLAERLDLKSSVRVAEAAPGMILAPGKAYIAPGDFHMVLARRGTNIVTNIEKGQPENSCRPSVDVLFRSVVQVYGGNVLGVVLTGMGQDGLRGCEKIREAGGRVIAQDEASSVVWGMPGFVAKAGLAENVATLNDVAGLIIRKVNESRLGRAGTGVPAGL